MAISRVPLVMVIVPMSVPIAPDGITVFKVFMVILDDVPPTVPDIEPVDTGVLAPAPSVKVMPSASVEAPKVIAPVEEPPITVS